MIIKKFKIPDYILFYILQFKTKTQTVRVYILNVFRIKYKKRIIHIHPNRKHEKTCKENVNSGIKHVF